MNVSLDALIHLLGKYAREFGNGRAVMGEQGWDPQRSITNACLPVCMPVCT